MTSIETAVRAAREQGRPALAPFLTAGFPAREGFADLLGAVCAAADVVELGVPFSDPLADGVTIQRASHHALLAGVSLGWILDVVASRRWPVPLVLMSYLNPLLARGLERFAAEAAEAGLAAVIVPDLPYEEALALRDTFDRAGLALVQLVTPVSPTERLGLLCEASRGFVYAVTMTGPTGGNARDGADTASYLATVARLARLPVFAGFGIRDAQQFRTLGRHVDGVIVGSALIEALERNEDPARFLRALSGGGP